MAVTKGNEVSGATNATSASLTITTGAGPDNEIRVGVMCAAGESVSTVIWDSGGAGEITGTLIRAEQNTGSVRAEIWQINDPPASTTDQVSITMVTKARFVAYAIEFSGADVDTGSDDAGSAPDAATSVSNTALNVVSGDWVIDALAIAASQNSTEGANQTEIVDNAFHASISGAGSQQDGANGGVMSWSSLGTNDIAHAAVRVPAAAGAGAATVSVSDPQGITLSPQGPTAQAGASVFTPAPQPITIQPQDPNIETGASILVQAPQAVVISPQEPNLERGASVFTDPGIIVLSPQGPTIDASAPAVQADVDVSDPQGLIVQPQGPAVQAGASIFVDGAPLVQRARQFPGLGVIVEESSNTKQFPGFGSLAEGIAQGYTVPGLTLSVPGPALQAGASIFADPAGLVIVAPGPTITAVVAGAGATVSVSDPAILNLLANGPTIRTGASISVVNAQGVVIDVIDPTLQSGSTISVAASVSLSLAPEWPTVQSGVSVFADPANLTITAPGPTLRTGASIPTDAPRTLILAPGDPALQAGASVFTDIAELVLSPQGPTVEIVGGAATVNVSSPAGLTLVPIDPTIAAGIAEAGRIFGVTEGKGVGNRSVRDPRRDVGDDVLAEYHKDD